MPCDIMLFYQWTFATLTVLTALFYLKRYWKSSPLPYLPSLPSPPSFTSLQGMPPELRNQIYEFVASNTLMQAGRVVSGKKLVAAYENSHAGHHVIRFVCTLPIQICKVVAIIIWEQERRPVSYKRLIAAYGNLHTKEHEVRLVRTNLKWYLGRVPMPNILVPVVDVASVLPLATARQPLSNTSRQLRAEFQFFDKQASGGEYLFILNNFDLRQMGIIAASIHALDTEARARGLSAVLHFHICFAIDHNAVSSARKLCA